MKMRRIFKTGLAALLALVIVMAGAASVLSAAAAQSDIPEWAVDDHAKKEIAATGARTLPSKYDLRDEGVVTPVKDQADWSTCWAFSMVAAAETSILSSLGTTYEETPLDFSERHLAYYAWDHITEDVDPKQVGEGSYFIGEEDDPHIRFSYGGFDILSFTLFSQGIGPVSEAEFPYRGVNENGTSTYLPDKFCYSTEDDWTIPVYDENGSLNRNRTNGYVLKDGNYLPQYWDEDDKDLPSGTAAAAIKQELINGRAVSTSYDASWRYRASSKEKGTFYASYCSDDSYANHAVCIVGWDDNYDASNFTHTTDCYGNQIYDLDGNPMTDEEAVARTTPPGNGAWIVKNSWGSDTDSIVDDLGNVINKYSCGVNNEEGLATGCFYLSYYDKSISECETVEFSSNLMGQGEFDTYQYDYMPALIQYYTEYNDAPISSANIFRADEDSQLYSVSTGVEEENTRVTFAVYLLDDDAETPTDGEMVYRLSKNFEHGGFHRVDLDLPVTLKEGQRFSVVSTASYVNEEGARAYSLSANRGLSKATAEYHNIPLYNEAVVNPGESFIYKDGEWSDWSEYIQDIPTDEDDEDIVVSEKYIEVNPVDNFSIKAYLVPVSESVTGLLGDADLDGEVGITDVTTIQRFDCKMIDLTVSQRVLADVDRNDEVSIIDATWIQRWELSFKAPEGIGEPV